MDQLRELIAAVDALDDETLYGCLDGASDPSEPEFVALLSSPWQPMRRV